MSKRAPPETVNEYVAGFPPPARAALRRVRAAIRKALPKAEETISYRIPTYRLGGRYVIYFAGWKTHYSIYPATADLIARFRDELAPYEVNGKGTIRFPLSAPVPADLITAIAAFKGEEAIAGLRGRTSRTTTRTGRRSKPSVRGRS